MYAIRSYYEWRAGDDHQIGFAGGVAQHFSTEAGDVEAWRHAGHHLDEAARETEEHRPETVLAPPVDGVIKSYNFV